MADALTNAELADMAAKAAAYVRDRTDLLGTGNLLEACAERLRATGTVRAEREHAFATELCEIVIHANGTLYEEAIADIACKVGLLVEGPVGWNGEFETRWADDLDAPAAPAEVDHSYVTAASAPPAAPQGSAWQPIETAPKDGTRVWAVGTEDPCDSYRWENTSWGGGWYDRRLYRALTLTHWMPLPELPATPGGVA